MSRGKVTIIGSGPAGVSAAWPLVQAGIDVLMLDAGKSVSTNPDSDRPALNDIRKGGDDAWRYLLQSDLSGLRNTDDTSPKIRCAVGADFEAGYSEANNIKTENYMAIGSLTVGGLSGVWGASVPAFDESDLETFPIGLEQMKPSYRAVAERIGISRAENDLSVNGEAVPSQPALPLSGVAAEVFSRRLSAKSCRELDMAPMRHAILSENKGDRTACDLGGACMWGCARGAVYNSAVDIEYMSTKPNFTLLLGRLVVRLEKNPDGGYIIHTRDPETNAVQCVNSETLILAAGTLPSTRLILGLLERYDEDITLLTTPGCVAAFTMPSKLFSTLPDKLFGLAQLAIRRGITERPWDYVYGLLFDGTAMPLPDLITHMPFTRVGAIRLARFLLPSLAIVLFNFPGEYSRCHVTLFKSSEGGVGPLQITGGYMDGFETVVRGVMKEIAKDFRKIGLYLLPMTTNIYSPGSVNHHAGTLPMGAATSMFGEVKGAAGVFVVDGSVLNRLPSKNHTFTVMANADRIGRYIARQIA